MKNWISALMCVAFLTLAGCEFFNPIGPLLSIGIAWVEGEAHKYYEADQQTVYEATHYALKQLDFPVTKDERNGDMIYIRADTGDRFKIKIERVRHNVTKLSIRVNIMGDKPYAELVYKRVDEYPGVRCFQTVEQLKTRLREKR